jgi:hypothetical protein
LSDVTPDIIIATETWLHPGIAGKVVLPDNYQFLTRKGRPSDPHGGVANIAQSEITGVQIDTDTFIEFTAASITSKHCKDPAIIGSIYRPPHSKIEYSNELSVAIKNLAMKHRGSVILIGGDTNLPGIDLKTSTSSRNNPEQPNSILINTVFDISGERVVDFPTRGITRWAYSSLTVQH